MERTKWNGQPFFGIPEWLFALASFILETSSSQDHFESIRNHGGVSVVAPRLQLLAVRFHLRIASRPTQ